MHVLGRTAWHFGQRTGARIGRTSLNREIAIQTDPGKLNLTRRQFMRGSAATILGYSTLAAKLSALDAGATITGELTADLTAPGTPFNRMLFGQFLEHFQRQVYGGVFDPGSPLADENGFALMSLKPCAN